LVGGLVGVSNLPKRMGRAEFSMDWLVLGMLPAGFARDPAIVVRVVD
jgi:hypothetical protein